MDPRALLALAVLLAGCMDPGATQLAQADAPMAAPTAEADAESGGIEGVVTDDSLAPIANAQIQVTDLGETQSDPQGRFTFSRIPPGEYTLHAVRLGYEAKASRVTITAGEITPVNVILVALAIQEPYVETAIKAGEIMCSAYLRVYSGLPGAIGLCTPIDDKFRTQWSWTDMDGLTGMWIETTWRSTQVAGNGLELYVPFGVGTTHWTYLARNVIGTNPIQHPVPGETLEDFLEGHKESLESCPTKTCVMQIWHYTYGSTLGSNSQVDAGVLLQQKYEDYVTLFYNTDFPEEFTALADG